MNIPGFTAEASLYQVNERYHMVEILVTPADEGKVLPQLVCVYDRGSRCCCMWGVCECYPTPGQLPR
jgi:hypothetical protein